MIHRLDLSLFSQDSSQSSHENFYQVTVLWDNERRLIPVSVVVGDPVVGMGLLQGYSLQIQVTQHGIVTVDRIR
ncbi:hypothetical protein [[Limnothrix rosea] IAM M-220]|uniref:hypothetical protein n=1 Tax=[Limnothrix rosea] IAM M-220 TaxID=454133 RepID=UPI001115A4B4|nr:hypothetical protein [[Limnothrix rosea] IAM M-220]